MKVSLKDKLDLNALLTSWAISEKYLMKCALCDDKTFLLQKLLENRAPLIASVMNAEIKSINKITLSNEDTQKYSIRFLNQKDRDKDTMNMQDYATSLYPDRSKYADFNPLSWNFIAVARPKQSAIVLIDGLHRFSHWYKSCNRASNSGMYPSYGPVYDKTISGYLITTGLPLKCFEDTL